jgi:hypothetical protein
MSVPKTMPRIVKLLELGMEGHKRFFANKVPCDQRTAQKILGHLWLEEIVYIKSWMREHGAPLPVYAIRDKRQQDAPRPAPFTATEKKARRDPEKVRGEQRIRRSNQKALSGEVRLGVWGL